MYHNNVGLLYVSENWNILVTIIIMIPGEDYM